MDNMRSCKRVSISCKAGRLKTQQHCKNACDINQIVAKYQKTGMIANINAVAGWYGDVSNVPDYQEALNRVESARIAFDGLPSLIRERFENKPERLMAFLADVKNKDEAEKLGLLKVNKETIINNVPVKKEDIKHE